MKKCFLLICIIFFLAACEKKQVNNTFQEGIRHVNEQYAQNVISENFSLLAIKYGLDKKTLIDIVCQYEKMTSGSCWSKGEINLFSDDKTDSDVSSAIEQVSNKYQIKKEILAEILIDKKMLETGSHE